MISKSRLYDNLYKTIIEATTTVPFDVEKALQQCLKKEIAKSLASLSLSTTLSNLKISQTKKTFCLS
jgi:tartrate dehydratase alpha subunit/fumarate hydratase class I-like protein